ncbi:hypothetical protein GNK26_13335, partial [Listeria monocytogenes]|nr:hypothetical protein [Listeria monocytogenes]
MSKTVDGVTTNYHYDGDSIDVLYETDGDGKVVRQYVYSDDNVRLAMKMNGKTLYYHYNAHGDVIALTDEAGKIVAEYAYDAWGNVLKNNASTEEAKANPYGYAGYTYDKEIEQYYLMARYYEPKQGVFTAYDPDPGDEDDPQTMNGYNYANNNPVRYVDPDGHWVWLAINAGFAAYDGYKAYKKTKSWKSAGWAAAKGAVGGGKFKGGKKAYRFIKKAYIKTKKWNRERKWSKGTFNSSRASLNYHYNKHVVKKGSNINKSQYTKEAVKLKRKNRKSRTKANFKVGKGYKIKNGKYFGYYTRGGKIITYGKN